MTDFSHLGPPMMVVTTEERAQGQQPILYAWVRGDEVLYIGCSRRGVERPLSVGHEKLRDMQPGDQVLVWPARQGPHIYEQELDLIRRYTPRYNKPNAGTPCPGCGGRWKLSDRGAGGCHYCVSRRKHTPLTQV